MITETSTLTGPALNWAVAKAQGCVPRDWNASYSMWQAANYCTDKAQGGLIVEREKISTRFNCKQAIGWEAYIWTPTQHDLSDMDCNEFTCFGPTALIASMRCYVTSILGNMVDVPDQLLTHTA